MDKNKNPLPIISFLLSITAICFSLIAILKGEQEIEPVLTDPIENIPLSIPGDLPEIMANAKTLDLPDSLLFAGEPVPMQMADVQERLDRELHINTYWHSSTIFLLKRAKRWLPQIEPVLKEHGIPDDFKYVAVIESGLSNVTSPSDAVGFWQFVEGTGKEYGLEINKFVDERYDPLKATEAACLYLKEAHERFQNWTNVAASYNRGMNGLRRAIENQQTSNYYDLYLNSETSRYMFRVLACKEIFEHPEKYGFDVSEEHLYLPEKIHYVEVTESIDDLVQFSIDHGTNYKILKRFNPWLMDYKLPVKKERVYRIALPGNGG